MKVSVGYFFVCLACKATFIRTTPEDWTVRQTGGKSLIANDKSQSDKHRFVRCPDCLSKNVRLAEIGDRK